MAARAFGPPRFSLINKRTFGVCSSIRIIKQQNPLNALVGMICTWPAGESKPCGAARVAAKDILSKIFLTCWMMNGSKSWPTSAWIDCELKRSMKVSHEVDEPVAHHIA